MLKRIYIITLTIISLLVMGGCGKEKPKRYTIEEKKELVMEYMKNKYGEEFEGSHYARAELMMNWDRFYVYPKNGSKEEMTKVIGEYDEDGVYQLSDNYVFHKIRPEYEKVMRTFIDEYFEEYKVYITLPISYKINWWNREKHIDGFDPKKEIINADMTTNIYVRESMTEGVSIKDTAEKIALKMAENEMGGKIDIIVIRDDKFDFIILDWENWQKASQGENLVEIYCTSVNL